MKRIFLVVFAAFATLSAISSAITLDPSDVVVPVKINGTAYDVRVAYKDIAFAMAQIQSNAPTQSTLYPGANFKAADGHVYSIAADGTLWRDGRSWLSTKVLQLIFVGPEIYAYGASTGALFRYCAAGCTSTWVAVAAYPNGLLDKVPAQVSNTETGAGPTFAGQTAVPSLSPTPGTGVAN